MSDTSSSQPFTTPSEEFSPPEKPLTPQKASSSTQSIRNVKDLVTLLEELQAHNAAIAEKFQALAYEFNYDAILHHLHKAKKSYDTS